MQLHRQVGLHQILEAMMSSALPSPSRRWWTQLAAALAVCVPLNPGSRPLRPLYHCSLSRHLRGLLPCTCRIRVQDAVHPNLLAALPAEDAVQMSPEGSGNGLRAFTGPRQQRLLLRQMPPLPSLQAVMSRPWLVGGHLAACRRWGKMQHASSPVLRRPPFAQVLPACLITLAAGSRG